MQSTLAAATAVLRPMVEAAFSSYVDEAVAAYARDKVAAGQWAEDAALANAGLEFLELLPQGLATPDNFLFEIVGQDGATAVGVLWVATQERAGRLAAYVYDLAVHPAHQRQGHASRALTSLEAKVRAAGLAGIGLHVFGHNRGAQALYARLGYLPININMFKTVAR
ncbi:N-acetyltransferase domain-containing protein [Rubrivivax sp. A210]|uniref:GNAT family N-acetyltransferase n=1 Tax=Rubrivivax sp. A210 TaxID=2772301 RepID=UPI0019186545|nr:GNAT family N-acetyltransferase [Rubrivivax sp. A210]CAD5371983.1 N-acetyltransferase domain-containing protein [Rubrivivax sp. A210]